MAILEPDDVVALDPGPVRPGHRRAVPLAPLIALHLAMRSRVLVALGGERRSRTPNGGSIGTLNGTERTRPGMERDVKRDAVRRSRSAKTRALGRCRSAGASALAARWRIALRAIAAQLAESGVELAIWGQKCTGQSRQATRRLTDRESRRAPSPATAWSDAAVSASAIAPAMGRADGRVSQVRRCIRRWSLVDIRRIGANPRDQQGEC